MCCKLLDIPGLAVRDLWCPHAEPGRKGGACTIYEDRPQACVDFACLWKQSVVLKEDIAPHRCGIVFEHIPEENIVLVMVDKHKSANWRKGPSKDLIKQMGKDGSIVWIIVGKDRHLLLPKGVTEKKAKELTELAFMRKKREEE